jgi:thiamine pyrophosphokinase
MVKGVLFFIMRASIIANGKMDVTPEIRYEIQSSSLKIAADGGINNCKVLGILPNVIIGDLDSMRPEEASIFSSKGVNIIQYPTRKDETDLELALRFVVDNRYDEVIIVGSLGARWDMTIANILLIAHPMFGNLHVRLLDGTQELFLLRAGEQSMIESQPGDTVSLIPLAGNASGIITHGLEYPLKDEMLHFGATRGISNVITEENAQIFIKEGLLLCVVNKVANR